MTYKIRCLLLFISIVTISKLNAGSHTVNRYFTLSDTSDEYRYTSSPRCFATTFVALADNALARSKGHSVGIGALSGDYHLQNIINSISTVQGADAIIPLQNLLGSALSNADLPYKVGGKLSVNGVCLQYQVPISTLGISCGFSLPVIQVFSTARYVFDNALFAKHNPNLAMTSAQKTNTAIVVDQARRSAHDMMELYINDWAKTMLGDLDFYMRWNYTADHILLLKSLDCAVQGGLTLPTSGLIDNNYPAAIPVANNNHHSVYGVIAPEFELKQDLKVGFVLLGQYLFQRQKTLRQPVLLEPAQFSALVGDFTIKPGFTFGITPYITFENLVDGLNFQFGYAYSKHNKDSVTDVRSNTSDIPSYLTQQSSATTSAELISSNISNKEYLSSWRRHYLNFLVSYNTKEALQKTIFSPTFYAEYRYPFEGRGVGTTYQFMCGVSLNF